MVLERILEPEVMDTEQEAQDYDQMDHTEVNISFVEDLIQFATQENVAFQNVLDLGTGTALIPIELCRQHGDCKTVAIDMAEHMLALARKNVAESQCTDRVELQKCDAKALPFSNGQFGCVMSNSIVHHIPEPRECIAELIRVVDSGGIIFVRDLMRPENDQQVKQLVQTYTGDENEHSQQMFDDSLRAALSLDEMQTLVSELGFQPDTVTKTTDRHWTWAAVKK